METDQTGAVTLTWSLASDLELGQHFIALWVVDENGIRTRIVDDMREQTSYTFTAAPGSHRFEVELLGGRAVFPPAASFTYQPPAPVNGSELLFTDTSTDADGTVTAWSWTFGDGGTSTRSTRGTPISDLARSPSP